MALKEINNYNKSDLKNRIHIKIINRTRMFE